MSVVCLFFSSRRRHTRCALVTGVQTCALPILGPSRDRDEMDDSVETKRNSKAGALLRALCPAVPAVISAAAMIFLFAAVMPFAWEIGRASCRDRVCPYV